MMADNRPYSPKQTFEDNSVQLADSFCPAVLEGQPIPERQWIVNGLIPANNVTMLAGDGGLGKSLLAMQLMTCAATGRPWLGLAVEQCPTIGVFCEDDRTELHIRQDAINRHYGCQFSDLSSCLWKARVGHPNVLMHFSERGAGSTTDFYREICEDVMRTKARLVALDSLHDIFSGDENRRGAARQFINALRAMILPVNGAVLLLSHPSLSGMSSGTGNAGSTAWNNAVRSRLYLTLPGQSPYSKGATQTEDNDPDERIIHTKKSNYGPRGGKIPVAWRDGVFVRPDALQASFVDRLAADVAVLDGLRQLVDQGSKVACDPNAKTSLANLVRKLPVSKHLAWAVVSDAQARLLAAGKIEKAEMGPPSRRVVYIRPSDMRYAGEIRGAE